MILQRLKAQMKKHVGDRYLYESAESRDEAWEAIEELHDARIEILLNESASVFASTLG